MLRREETEGTNERRWCWCCGGPFCGGGKWVRVFVKVAVLTDEKMRSPGRIVRVRRLQCTLSICTLIYLPFFLFQKQIQTIKSNHMLI